MALWLPVLWLAITGSRFVSQWINLGSGGTDAEDGNLIDVLYFLALLMAGVRVLVRRRIGLGKVMRNNLWLTLFVIYGCAAILWSDFPFIALKRWIKTLIHPIMALIILTDPDPPNALRTVMKRCAYLTMPLSVLFIKYYPEYGRGFSAYTGEAFNNGVATQKNGLGLLCMMFFIFFFWNLLTVRRIQEWGARQEEYILSIGFLCMSAWLLHMADSASSLAALLIGVLTISVIGMRIVNKRFLGTYLIVGALVAIGLQSSFDIYGTVLDALGRDPTLTDRTMIWAECVALVDNPIIGTGFESFWLGPRPQAILARWEGIHQSHNGYVEIYLNLGYIGVFLLFGVIISSFRKIAKDLLSNFEFARLRLGFLFAIIFYNYGEATFQAVHPLWTIFYIIALDFPWHTGSRIEPLSIAATRLRMGAQTLKSRRIDGRKAGASDEAWDAGRTRASKP